MPAVSIRLIKSRNAIRELRLSPSPEMYRVPLRPLLAPNSLSLSMRLQARAISPSFPTVTFERWIWS